MRSVLYGKARLTRRQFLKAAVATAALTAAAPRDLTSALAKEKVITLDYFTLFHSGDAAAMEQIVRRFNAEHKAVKINLLQG